MTDLRLAPAGHGPRLSALMVNYQSGQFAVACARSLRQEWASAGYDPRRLELIVIDNASPGEQAYWLDLLEAEGARVLVQPTNLGYAGAVQAAFEASHGEEDDYVAILNSDLVFLPGSVGELVAHLETFPDVGAVAPHCFVDEECTFQLPSLALPGAGEEFAELIGRLSTTLARRRARSNSDRALASWTDELPRRCEMLSGACLFLPRHVVQSLGCLMDRRYPLYYEDADLCRRLMEHGFTLAHHPHALVLHHWSRSAGSASAFAGDPRRRWEIAHRAYRERWMGRVSRLGLSLLERLVERCPGRWIDRPIHGLRRLMPTVKPIELTLPGEGPWLLELAMIPTWSLSATCLVTTGTWRFPTAAWDWLYPGRYYLRAVHTATGFVGGAWTFNKSTPARTEAVEVPAGPQPPAQQERSA